MTHVRELLEASGVPFEAAVASDCRRFAAVYDDDETRASSSRIVYGDMGNADNALREVDQCVSLYQELALGQSVGMQLQFQIPIECKHRQALQLFGFEVGAATEDTGHHPFVFAGWLANSRRFADVVLTSDVAELRSPVREIAALVDPSGKDRPKVLKEQLIYKAASALMDFVAFDCRAETNKEGDRVLESLGLLDSFGEFTTKNRYSPMMVAERWLQDELDKYADAFADQYHGGRRIYHMANVYLPIICADAEIFEASLCLDGRVDTLESTPLMLTGVRTPGWPQRILGQAPNIGPEALITVTNREGLQDLLPQLYAWFAKTAQALLSMDEAEVRAVLLESAFMSAVRRSVRGSRTSVRSDLPLDWQI